MFYNYIIGANFSQQQSSLDHSGMQNVNVTIDGGRLCLVFHLDAGKVEPKWVCCKGLSISLLLGEVFFTPGDLGQTS